MAASKRVSAHLLTLLLTPDPLASSLNLTPDLVTPSLLPRPPSPSSPWPPATFTLFAPYRLFPIPDLLPYPVFLLFFF